MSNSTKDIPKIAPGNYTIYNKYQCYSGNVRFQSDITWTIQHFNLYVRDKRRNVITSSTFSTTGDNCKWYLELHTAYQQIFYDGSKGSNINTMLYLKTRNDKTELYTFGPLTGEVQCSIIDLNGQKQNTRTGNFFFDSGNFEFCFTDFIKDNSTLNHKLCPRNELTISCMVSFMRINAVAHIDQHNNSSPSALNAYIPSPLETFKQLFINEELSDVTINVGNKKFPGHKIILAAQSPVFKAMFTHDMKEKQQSRIDIKDIDEKIFLEVLRYIYTGRVENIKPIVFQLLVVADKYDLAGLKMMCENQLGVMLAVDTAVQILSVSNAFNLQKLKNLSIQHVKKNLTKITDLESWNDLASQPDLMKAVLKA